MVASTAPQGDNLRPMASPAFTITPSRLVRYVILIGALAVVVAGITASSAWQSEKILVMRPGETVTIAGYSLAFEGVEEIQGPNYTARRGTLRATRNGREVATLIPEKRFYPVRNSATTEAAIHTTWLADLYAVLGDGDGRGGWIVRLYHNPLVPWIWIGVVVMALGGLVSLSDRRLHVGAPGRARSRATTPRPPDERPATA